MIIATPFFILFYGAFLRFAKCRRIYLSVGKTAISRGRAEGLTVFTTHNHNRVLVVNSVVRLSHNSQPQQAPLKGCACSCGCCCECDNPRAPPIPPTRRHGVPISPVDGGCFPQRRNTSFRRKTLAAPGPAPRECRRVARVYVRLPTAIGRRSPPIAPNWPSPPLYGTCARRHGAIRPCRALMRSHGRLLAPARRAESCDNLVTIGAARRWRGDFPCFMGIPLLV